MKEPLKDKKQDCNEIQALDYEGKVVEFYEMKDVLDAVDWLVKELVDIRDVKISAVNDLALAKMNGEKAGINLAIRKIGEAFPDIYRYEK